MPTKKSLRKAARKVYRVPKGSKLRRGLLLKKHDSAIVKRVKSAIRKKLMRATK